MDDLGERTEEPTARKLDQARQRGQVPKSQDLSGAITLLGALLIFVVLGSTVGAMFLRILRRTLGGEIAADIRSTESMAAATKAVAYDAMVVLVPIMVLSALVAYLAGFVQVGWLITAEPIRPKLSKLSPLAGIKRILGIRALVKTLVNSLKLTAMVAVSALFILANLDSIASMPKVAPLIALMMVLRLIFLLALILVVLLIFIALIDYIYQRWQHTKDLRMSKQEVKDERKTMEGDPLMKGKHRQMAREILMQQVGKAVPEADVIVTNPTHFSVAIRYDPETMGAPRVTAKGADLIALRIRQLARQNDVPIVERPPLARALYWGSEVGQEIPLEHYEAVAELLAYVYRIDTRAEQKFKRQTRDQNRAETPVGV
ncbi:MAG: flagellar biosynthesis protein FlhB [Phycisphaerales bacterium]